MWKCKILGGSLDSPAVVIIERSSFRKPDSGNRKFSKYKTWVLVQFHVLYREIPIV